MSLTLWCRRGIRVVACLAVLGFVLAPLAGAQSQGTGQIVGTVFDSSGGAIPNAKVTVTGDTFTVQKSATVTWEFTKDASTKGAVKAGDRVTVHYRMVATEIEANPGTTKK